MRYMTSSERRLMLLRRMAIACAVLVLVITSLSAFMRLTRTGLGCQPWPQCYGQEPLAREHGGAVAVDPVIALARIAHRIVAVSALLLVIAMLLVALAQHPVLQRQGRMALGLLALALFLAVLGRWTADARAPAVTLGNLLGGMGMFALSWRMALTTARADAPASGAARPRLSWAWFCFALVLLEIALGGLVNAAHAGLSCPRLSACDLAEGSWQAFNPWREPQSDPAHPNNPAGALLHLAHRLGGLVLEAALLPLGATAWRRGRPVAATLVLVLLALQAGLGAGLVLGALPLALALGHNLASALLLAVVLNLTDERRGRVPA